MVVYNSSMEKVSSLVSKKVISLDDASQVGYVLNVIFDDRVKFFTGLIIVDDESENSFVLDREDIYSIGDETIMIKSARALQFNISSITNNPVGKVVYDSHGNNLGRVIDVDIKGKTVKKIITNMCEFPQRFIRKSGENFIIFGAYKSEKNRSFKEEVGSFKGLEKTEVRITNFVVVQPQTPESPAKIFANPKLLIGRIVTNDILGYNNELIAEKNDVINQKILNKAKLHNKMNLLNYYSK